ncbi:MAG: isochorismatase family protein [Pseudomonadota bacterium]
MKSVQKWATKTELPDLENSALLVLDLQRFFFDPESHANVPTLKVVLPNILALISHFRACGRPIVFTRHGTPDQPQIMMNRWWKDPLQKNDPRAQLISEIDPQKDELILDKTQYSAFFDTELRTWLIDRECNTVVICGVTTHLCCETTAREAFMLNFQPVVLADACATWDEELHVGALRNLAHGFAVVSDTNQLLGRKPAIEKHSTLISHSHRSVDLVVVGAGPAGIAAAIQAKRCGMKILLLDKAVLGGHARIANWIENYPGFPSGISGADLMDRFAAQIDEWEIQVMQLQVVSVDSSQDRMLSLALKEQQETLNAKAVILATGTAFVGLDLEIERHVVHRIDELPSIRDKNLLIVGGGEAAFDQALFAKQHGASSVTMAIRSTVPKAMGLLVQRVKDQGVTLLFETKVIRIDEHNGAKRVSFGDRCLDVDGIIVCIGTQQNLPILPPNIEMMFYGSPATDSMGRTNIEGLYLAGDVKRGLYRQVGVAVGDGIVAAMDASRYVTQEQWRS